MRSRGELLLGALAGALTACTHTIDIRYTRPAEVNLREIKQIAIGEISGEGAAALEGDLGEAIFNSGRFTLLDRRHTQDILQEISFSASGLVDETTAARVGKLFGASAL